MGRPTRGYRNASSKVAYTTKRETTGRSGPLSRR